MALKRQRVRVPPAPPNLGCINVDAPPVNISPMVSEAAAGELLSLFGATSPMKLASDSPYPHYAAFETL